MTLEPLTEEERRLAKLLAICEDDPAGFVTKSALRKLLALEKAVIAYAAARKAHAPTQSEHANINAALIPLAAYGSIPEPVEASADLAKEEEPVIRRYEHGLDGWWEIAPPRGPEGETK